MSIQMDKISFSRDVIKVTQSTYVERKRKKARRALIIKLIKQTLLLILIAIFLIFFLIVGELLYKDVGFDWSESTLVKMIIERRTGIPAFD